MSQPPYPQQPEYPGQPPQYQQQPPKKKLGGGKIALIVIGIVVLACCGGGAIVAMVTGGKSGTDSASSSQSSPPGSAGKASAAPKASPAAPTRQSVKSAAGVGDAVRDGKFQFVVPAAPRCGVARVGDTYVNQKAQGQFCLVKVTVKNIGDEAQLFDSSSQKAFNSAHQEYSADGGAAIYANSGNETFLNQINPGNSVNGTLVFDIPVGQKLAQLEFHDSPFSGGVTVTL